MLQAGLALPNPFARANQRPTSRDHPFAHPFPSQCQQMTLPPSSTPRRGPICGPIPPLSSQTSVDTIKHGRLWCPAGYCFCNFQHSPPLLSLNHQLYRVVPMLKKTPNDTQESNVMRAGPQQQCPFATGNHQPPPRDHYHTHDPQLAHAPHPNPDASRPRSTFFATSLATNVRNGRLWCPAGITVFNFHHPSHPLPAFTCCTRFCRACP